MACHGVVRIFLGWQWQGERAAAGVPWRFGVAALQRPHVGVAGALATGREGAGGCGRAVAFSGVLYHNILIVCLSFVDKVSRRISACRLVCI